MLLPKLPPGFAVIHIWDLAQEQSQDAVKFFFDARYRLCPLQCRHSWKKGPAALHLVRQVPDPFPRLCVSGLSLVELCLPDTCLSLHTVALKETFSSVIFWNKAAVRLGSNDVFSWRISPPPGVAVTRSYVMLRADNRWGTALTKDTLEKASVSLLSSSKVLSCLH